MMLLCLHVQMSQFLHDPSISHLMDEFNCTGVASGFVWESNGMEVINDGIRTLISHAISVDAANGIRMSTLRMKVSSTDNATNITCTALKSSPLSSNRSAPALLLVQGNYYTIAI